MENNTTGTQEGETPDRPLPMSPTEERYHSNHETEGLPKLVSVDEDDVTVKSSEVDDNSTGMGKDDFLGKSKKEDS